MMELSPQGRHLFEPSALALGLQWRRRTSPEGGTVGKNLRRIGLDAVLLQQRQEFFLERHAPVMLGLVAHIFGNLPQV